MQLIIALCLIVGLIATGNLSFYLGKEYYVLTIFGLVVVWYALAKLFGLKGREIFWLLEYLGGAIAKVILLVVLLPFCAGFVSNFVKMYEPSHSTLLDKEFTWTFLIYTFLLFLAIAAIIGFLGYGHKPQKLIDIELEGKLSNLSTDELRDLKNNLEAENDKLRAKKEEKLREIVDEVVEEYKEEAISEIEKLKAENEALKKQLQDKETENKS